MYFQALLARLQHIHMVTQRYLRSPDIEGSRDYIKGRLDGIMECIAIVNEAIEDERVHNKRYKQRESDELRRACEVARNYVANADYERALNVLAAILEKVPERTRSAQKIMA